MQQAKCISDLHSVVNGLQIFRPREAVSGTTLWSHVRVVVIVVHDPHPTWGGPRSRDGVGAPLLR